MSKPPVFTPEIIAQAIEECPDNTTHAEEPGGMARLCTRCVGIAYRLKESRLRYGTS